ncbi:MAG: hypothetical protein WCR20_19365 [Verrucomicrobiota bacterium]
MNGLLVASTDSQTGLSPECLEARIRAEFRSLALLRREFPMLADWGVPDVGLAIHSLGLNYLAALGRHLGCPTVTEFPLVRADLPTNVALAGFDGLEVRPDVVWFDRKSREPLLLAEFERFDDLSARRKVLVEKTENLVLAHHLTGSQPEILLLALWTFTGVKVTGLAELSTRVRSGFRRDGGTRINGLSGQARFLVATFVFARHGAGIALKEVLL